MNKGYVRLFTILILLCAGITGIAVFKNADTKEEVSENTISDMTVIEPKEEPVTEPENLEPELEKQLSAAEILEQDTMKVSKKERVKVDLIIFAGQSNMAGFGGDASLAPKLTEGAGGEFRAVSNPTCLYTITEPFGFYENSPIMNDFYAKRGSLVTAFVNAYYQETGVPVVAVSASKGGMSSPYWASKPVCDEIVSRYRTAYDWLNSNGYQVRHKYLVFLQGENDVLEKIPMEQYLANMYQFSTALYHEGLDKFFMIRIGGTGSDDDLFTQIIDTQTELCRNNPNFVLASTVLSAYKAKDMVDEYHYTQQVLNDVGDDAGKNVGIFTNTWVEPSMYDYRYENTYVPMKME
ncbi:MAG: sialate O-acetylesterase [Lachnospiraceae bacterium]|nr:sialate O-acetylesterase [Lachnospiraceae bacterium]